MKTVKESIIRNHLFSIFILLLPFSWVNTSIGSLYRFATIILFLFFLLATSLRIIVPHEKRKYFRLWTAYIVYTSLATFYAGINTQQINVAIGMLLLFLISIVFAGSSVNKETINIIDYSFVFIGMLLFTLFVLGGRNYVGFTMRQSLVILGTMTDANEFASVFILPISVAFSLIMDCKGVLKKGGYIALIICCLWVVLSSGSRGAIISIIASILFTLLECGKIRLRTFVGLFFLVIIAIYLFDNYLTALLPQETLARLSFDALSRDGGSGRNTIWHSALRDWCSGSVFNIVFGYGYGRIWAYNGFGAYTTTMHNQFLQVLISYGLLGLSIYLSLVISALTYFHKYLKKYCGCFLGMLIMGLTITMGPSYKPLWIFLMLPLITIDSKVEDIDAVEIQK